MGISYRSAHCVAHTEVKATLFIHGVVQTRKLRQWWPVVVKGVVTKTVIGTGLGDKRLNNVLKLYFLHFSIYSCYLLKVQCVRWLIGESHCQFVKTDAVKGWPAHTYIYIYLYIFDGPRTPKWGDLTTWEWDPTSYKLHLWCSVKRAATAIFIWLIWWLFS